MRFCFFLPFVTERHICFAREVFFKKHMRRYDFFWKLTRHQYCSMIVVCCWLYDKIIIHICRTTKSLNLLYHTFSGLKTNSSTPGGWTKTRPPSYSYRTSGLQMASTAAAEPQGTSCDQAAKFRTSWRALRPGGKAESAEERMIIRWIKW